MDNQCRISGDETVDDLDDLTTSYPIVEIFHSVQGEGYRSGIPHIFIRFGRCNLRCEWCDTNFDTYQEMSALKILEQIFEFDCKNIILTGGEPTLHPLDPLCRLLRKRGYFISIETNGTRLINEDLIDWITVSPKDQEYSDLTIKQRVGDELKCVYVGQPLSMYDDLKRGFTHHFLQPCYLESKSVEWNGKNFALTESVIKAHPDWRLSLQTHKWMGIK